MKRARSAGALGGTHESAQLPRCGADAQTGARAEPLRPTGASGEQVFLPADDNHRLPRHIKCGREPDGITRAPVTILLDGPAGWSHKIPANLILGD